MITYYHPYIFTSLLKMKTITTLLPVLFILLLLSCQKENLETSENFKTLEEINIKLSKEIELDVLLSKDIIIIDDNCFYLVGGHSIAVLDSSFTQINSITPKIPYGSIFSFVVESPNSMYLIYGTGSPDKKIAQIDSLGNILNTYGGDNNHYMLLALDLLNNRLFISQHNNGYEIQSLDLSSKNISTICSMDKLITNLYVSQFDNKLYLTAYYPDNHVEYIENNQEVLLYKFDSIPSYYKAQVAASLKKDNFLLSSFIYTHITLQITDLNTKVSRLIIENPNDDYFYFKRLKYYNNKLYVITSDYKLQIFDINW